MKGWKAISCLIMAVTLAGCAGMRKNEQAQSGEVDKVEKEQVKTARLSMPATPIKHPRSDGSLWNEYDNNGYLFGDLRARQVGDIITIKIDENAKGTKDANTKTARDSKLSSGLDSFLGLPTANRGLGATSSNSTSGSGSTSRSGRLTASTTATVVEVLNNGNLVISGERKVMINSETQIIKLTGVIRQEDITPDNQVLSTYIANANIEYSGNGPIASKQRIGWGIKVIDWIWPF